MLEALEEYFDVYCRPLLRKFFHEGGPTFLLLNEPCASKLNCANEGIIYSVRGCLASVP